jgi:predicted Zn-dependent peptidase
MIVIKNDFKTIQIAVYLTDLETPDTRVYRFLLPKLMVTGTDQLPTRLSMNRRLEQLYGAYIKPRTERIGNLSVMSFSMTIADPKIVEDPKLWPDAIQLFKEVLFDHRAFNEEIFYEEKRMLIEQWETLQDKKRAYAQHQFQRLFFGDDPYGSPISGTLEQIKKTTLKHLVDYYQRTILHQAKTIVLNGHVDDQMKDELFKHLGSDIAFTDPFVTHFRAPRPLVKEVESTIMKQAIVHMGYILPIYRIDELYDAAVILDTILGGYPESRLFREIREKEGLCYDVSSNYDHYKGVLMISSGIDLSKVDFAIEQIKILVENMKNDGISAEELDHAKAYYIHQIKSSLDSQSTLTKRAFIRHLLNYQESVEARITHISNVTLEDVKKALSQLTIDTIYVLEGERP